jgi:hypothetical protein
MRKACKSIQQKNAKKEHVKEYKKKTLRIERMQYMQYIYIERENASKNASKKCFKKHAKRTCKLKACNLKACRKRSKGM